MSKSVKLVGNQIKISKSNSQYTALKILLSPVNEDGFIEKLYEFGENGSILIDRGLAAFLPELGLTKEELDEPNDLSSQVQQEVNPEILPGFVLRSEQVLVIKRALSNKRGFISAATGSGKSLMICGVIKQIKESIGYYPDTLVLVPTSYLKDEMIKLMSKVGIEAKDYSEIRESGIKGIVVSHPKALNNDLDNGMKLDNIKVLIADESHHLKAQTWSRLVRACVNTNYILGFSASIIPSDRLPILKLTQLSIDEIKILGTAGNILIDIPPSYYSDKDVLAHPKVIIVNHRADEKVSVENDWYQLRKLRLESPNRTQKLSQIAAIFNSFGLKVLVLINTHEHGYQILDNLELLGLSEVSACSYGNYKFYQKVDSELITLPKTSMEDFKNNKLQILIGSSHVFEGVDIPSLDVVIMGVVGRSPRRIIQAVGRSLRKSKKGKYAYIVDFTDSGGGVLEYHTFLRKKVYKEQIGVGSNDIYDKVKLSELPVLINNLEHIEGE